MIGVASILREMPEGYENACYETHAIQRKRGIKDPSDFMMLSLFHLLNGCSLMEISEIAKLSKLGEVSDVAFMNRFRNCNEWFKWVCRNLHWDGQIEYERPEWLKEYRVLAVDASDVSEKGRSGRLYRLHFALDIFNLQAASYAITLGQTGEKLSNFPLEKGDLVLADRIYTRPAGIEYCTEQGADYIMRMKSKAFTPYDEAGAGIDLYKVMSSNDRGEINAFVRISDGRNIPVRICYTKKTEEAIAATRKRLRQKESKKQTKLSEEAKLFNEYIVLVTSLPCEISFESILKLYRFRWQIEMYFKRLKSILDYGEMPKRTPESVMAWLNGKLMVALLIEKFLSRELFPPEKRNAAEHMA